MLSTFYLVTPMKDATRPISAGIPYVVCNGFCLKQVDISSSTPKLISEIT